MVKSRTECSVTLGWSPPPHGDRPVPIDGYLVEKKRLGAHTWSRCHEAEWVGAQELTVASVSEEGDFQFRVSALNSFGHSPYLEFPGTVHLSKCGCVPVACPMGLLGEAAIGPGSGRGGAERAEADPFLKPSPCSPPACREDAPEGSGGCGGW